MLSIPSLLGIESSLVKFGLLLSVVLALISFTLYDRLLSRDIKRGNIVILFVIFGLFIWSEHILLGPYSFIYVDDEGDTTIPLFYYIASSVKNGEQFSHSIAGGHDVSAMYASGAQIFSLPVLMMKIMPIWLSVALLKLFYYTIGVIGAYKLSRCLGANRINSFILSILFIFSSWLNIHNLIMAGGGWLFGPLITHLIVQREGRKHYFLGTIFAALLYSQATPTHVAPMLGISVFASAIILSKLSNYRVVVGIILLPLVSLMNWHEVLFSFTQYAEFSPRASLGGPSFGSVAYLSILLYFHMFILYVITILLTINNISKRIILAISPALVLIFVDFIVSVFPWKYIGLEIVGAISWGYAAQAFNQMVIMFMAVASHDICYNDRENKKIVTVGSISLFVIVFSMLSSKFDSTYKLIHQSGMAIYTNSDGVSSM